MNSEFSLATTSIITRLSIGEIKIEGKVCIDKNHK